MLTPDGDATSFIKQHRDKFLDGKSDEILYGFSNSFGQKQFAGARQLGAWIALNCCT